MARDNGGASGTGGETDTGWQFKTPTMDGFKLLEMTGAEGDQGLEPGSFTGYLARYGNLDENDDILQPGTFAQALNEFKMSGDMPPMLLNHGGIPWGAVTTVSLLPVGQWMTMNEDSRGLAVTGKIDPMDTDLGKQIYAGLKNRSVKGLSIGYKAQDFQKGTKPGDPRRLISRAALLEGSIVWMPANPLANITSVKSMFQGIIDQARAGIDEDFDPKNPRHLDKLLREAGLSRAETKGVMAIGFKALMPPRDASAHVALSDLLAGLRSARKAASS